MTARPLSIAIISAEIAPFSKLGGQADVAHALPKHLRTLGHTVSAVTPLYRFTAQAHPELEHVGDTVISVGKKKYPVRFLRSQLNEQSPVPVYFVAQEELFTSRGKVYGYPDDNLRFYVFSRAAFALYELLHQIPDILHAHDWAPGLVPNLLDVEYRKQPAWAQTASVFTIHNLLYQMQGMWYDVPAGKRDRGNGLPPNDPAKIRWANFSLRGIKHADAINAVSLRYAEEIMTKKFGEGLDGVLRRRKDRVFGIINGIDYTVFNPSFDPHVPIHYDWNSLDKKLANKTAYQKEFGLEVNPDIPLLGLAHRFTEQKGFNLIMEILPALLQEKVQLAVTGYGDRGYVRFFRQVVKRYPLQVAANLSFDEPMASRIYAASDMFLMPSRFEPCGVSQLISLRYGAIPIVHRVGGLAETITDFNPRTGVGNGFVFDHHTGPSLLVALTRGVETFKYPKVWEHLTWQGMRQSFSWELPARKYIDLYRQAIRNLHALD